MLLSLDWSVLSAFTLLWMAIVPTPGPNVLMVTHVALTRTPTHVALAIAGNLCGIALLAGLALLGWAALLQAFPWLRMAVNVLGGFYLMWVGSQLIRRARTVGAVAVPVPLTADQLPGDYRRTVLLGLITALSNAQAIWFITSIFAVAGVLNANMATGFATIVIIMVCNASYLATLGWLFQRESVRLGYARYKRVLEGVIGSLFVLFGGQLLWRAVFR